MAGLKDRKVELTITAKEPDNRIDRGWDYHTTQDPSCRFCRNSPETVQHKTAECKMLEGRAHMERHNQAAAIVYRNIGTDNMT